MSTSPEVVDPEVVDPAVGRPGRQRTALPVFFLLALVLTWGVWVPRVLESRGALDSSWARDVAPLSTYGPAMAAVLTAAWLGRPALRELSSRMGSWRLGARWWAVVLLGPAGLWLVAAGLHTALGGRFLDSRPAAVGAGLAFLVPLLVILALTDGLGEEVGWRGFALPRLLRRTGPVRASLLLGLFWAAWHAPLHWTDGVSLEGRPVWLLLLQLPVSALFFTWVFQRTGGSVLPAIGLHAALNLFGLPLPAGGDDWRPYLLFLGLQVVLAAALVASGKLGRGSRGAS